MEAEQDEIPAKKQKVTTGTAATNEERKLKMKLNRQQNAIINTPEYEIKQKGLELFQTFIEYFASFDAEQIPKLVYEKCREDTVFSSLWNSDSKDNPIYKEIRGSKALISYFCAVNTVFPDALNIFEPPIIKDAKGETDNEDCAYVINSNIRFEAHRVYEINVTDSAAAFQEAEGVKSALTGLTTLITNSKDQSASSAGPSVHETSKSNQKVAAEEVEMKTYSLDRMPVFVSTDKARFAQGAMFPVELAVKVNGTLQLQVDPYNRILRIKYSFFSPFEHLGRK